jgi:putative membrane protein
MRQVLSSPKSWAWKARQSAETRIRRLPKLDLQSDGRNKMAENAESNPRTALASHRTSFAKFRTSLALDRTTLSWIRTTVTFATFGLGMIGYFRSLEQSTHSEQAMRLYRGAVHMGVGLVVIGLVATVLAASSHWVILRKLRRGEELVVSQWPLTITIAVFIAILGAYGLWSALTP